jgi:hypothetical protein
MRAQVGDLQPSERLQPRQQTGDTFVKPAEAPVNNDLSALSSALGSFSSALFSASKAANKAPQDDPREAEARRIVLSMQDKDLMQKVGEGAMPWQSVPVVAAFYNAHAGERAAKAVLEPLRMGVEQGTIPLYKDDGTPLDISTIARERASAAVGSYGRLANSEHFMKSYFSTFDSNRGALETAARGQQAKLNSDELKNQAATAMDSYLQGSATHADPAVTAKGLLDTYGKVRSLYGQALPNSAIEDVLLGRLRVASERDPDTVIKILEMDRGKGQDGQQLGRLLDNGRLSGDAREIFLKARQQQSTNFDKTQTQAAAQAALESFKRGDGSFNQLADFSYENPYAGAMDRTKKVSAESAKDMAMALHETQLTQKLSSQRVPTEQAQAEIAEQTTQAYIGSNIPNKKWQAAITDTGRILGNELDVSNPAHRDKLLSAARLYRTIEDRNPGYANETLKVGEREKNFFNMARFYEEEWRMPPDLAVQRAALYASRPKVPLSAEAKDAIETASKKVSSAFWQKMLPGAAGVATTTGFLDSLNPFSTSPQNVMAVQRRVKAIAEVIASDQSIPADKAVEAALKTVQRQSVLINGQAIHSDPFVNKESQQAVERKLEEVRTGANGNIRNSSGEKYDGPLSILPLPGRKGLYIAVTPSGDPLATATPDGRYSPLQIKASDIEGMKAKMRDQQLSDMQLKQAEKSLMNERALVYAQDKLPESLKGKVKESQQALDAAGIKMETPAQKKKRLEASDEASRVWPKQPQTVYEPLPWQAPN